MKNLSAIFGSATVTPASIRDTLPHPTSELASGSSSAAACYTNSPARLSIFTH